jgi:hypothetical protein
MTALPEQRFRILTIVLFLLAIESIAQDIDHEVRRIQGLISEGEWVSARRALDVLKPGCKSKQCVGKLNFTYGYLYHQKFNRVEGAQELWRDSAKLYYQDVLRDFPNSTTAYQNLALLYKGSDQSNQSISWLLQAYALNADNSYLISIGDQFLQQQEYDSAYRYYRLCASNDPLLRQAHDRLIHLYNVRQMSADQVMPHCRQMAGLGFDELATKALVQLIQRDYVRAPQDCERAFVWWTNIVGRNLSIDTLSLRSLPADWKFQGVDELRKILTSDWSLDDLRWWRNEQPINVLKGLDLKPNQVICEVIRAKAQQLQKRNRIEACIAEYEKAYKVVQGRQSIYAFLERADLIPDIFYQLASELAMLYTKYASLDPGGKKFKELESELFSGKGEAYMAVNKEAILKFHTSLGLIYAERNQWRGGRFQNGIYQLTNAIDRAPEAKNTAYLKVLLAKGQLNNEQVDQARRLLVDAAASYLNDDNFASVESVLARYDSIGGAPNTQYTLIKQLTIFRKDIDQLPEKKLLATREMLRTIDAMLSAGEGSAYFNTIQRFKILSDLAGVANQFEDKRATISYYGQALQQAFMVNALTNLTDVERLNKQRAALLRTMSFTNTPKEATIGQSSEVAVNMKAWELYADNFKKQTIILSSDLLSGANVAAEFSSLPTEVTRLPAITIDKSKIIIENNLSPTSVQLRTALRTKGVKFE